MQLIHITEEQRERLCNELAKIIIEFRKDNTIECIFYRSFVGVLGYGQNVLDMVVVTKGGIEEDDMECVNKYKYLLDEHYLMEYGVRIHVCMDSANLYSISAHNSDEIIRQNELFNSTILFDRTGKYIKIKEKIQHEGKKKESYYYEDLALLFPSIAPTLKKAMNVMSLEKRSNHS